ncbi:9228_t:CDS:2, partial [Acaulospora colombiana]
NQKKNEITDENVTSISPSVTAQESDVSVNNDDVVDELSNVETILEPVKELNMFIAANKCFLEYVHDSTGLPWWATIMLSTIFLRSVFTLPIAIWQQKNAARLLNAQPRINGWFEKLKHQVARKMRSQGRSYEEFQAELQKKVFSKKRICLHTPYMTGHVTADEINDFENGGFLWFSDLTAVDPTLFFPLAIGATNLFNIELHRWTSRGKPSTRQKVITNIGRGLSIIMVPVATKAPMVGDMFVLAYIKLLQRGAKCCFQNTIDSKKVRISSKGRVKRSRGVNKEWLAQVFKGLNHVLKYYLILSVRSRTSLPRFHRPTVHDELSDRAPSTADMAEVVCGE